jgi:hypothetical protein
VDEMDDLERTLRRYRPAGPDGELRDRIVAAASSPSAERTPVRAREWLPAVAALVFAVLFYWFASMQNQLLDARFAPVSPDDQLSMEMEAPR